ncbi:hypothetical protein JG687_00012089 [Phytophthora cactorum]|uniref:Pre-mRNA-splicing factor Syf1-like N-terminal HAT-repeats domain-containing protein n=1 Tax=Phytophthora cactorum TaxID=29920 RepID=A0A8T1U2U7_9STRA|nr:hypothetical protein JG687_00012089 [Phytophthora cactorum]
MTDEIATWDASGVVARAKVLIHSSNVRILLFPCYEKVVDARKDVDDTLAKWVASIQAQSDAKSAARGSIVVVALWRQYAALEMELRQFKQATKVFERAVSCPIAGSSTALWLQYADFCVQRKKYSNARKIFVRALQTLPEREQTAVWARFYGFVCTHVDNKLSLAMLQHQVMPDKFPQPGTTSASPSTATAPATSAPVATATLPSTLQPQQQPKTGAVSLVDPVVAFIDKTGEVTTPSPSPLAVESVGHAGAVKRPSDPRLAGDAKRAKQEIAAPTAPAEPSAFFSHIPVTLPFIPSCPHLLFDSVADGEAQKQIGNELLERLSDVLGDSAVFEGVRDLRDNQRSRDREMLYRWQELVGMQMKEGSELFARHVALEMQHGFSDPRGLIALKTQHLEQRREFSSRCQMSQQQFIDICAMDRANALKAQQISLENMKIPEMKVTTEAEAISLQVHVECLILEAEKLWREENQRSADAAKKSQQTSSAPSSLLVGASVAVGITGRTHAELATGAGMGTIAAAIVTRVEVGAARTSGTSSPLNQVLLAPLLRLHSSIHVTITLDNRLRLRSKCLCMIVGRSSHVPSSSNRTDKEALLEALLAAGHSNRHRYSTSPSSQCSRAQALPLVEILLFRDMAQVPVQDLLEMAQVPPRTAIRACLQTLRIIRSRPSNRDRMASSNRGLIASNSHLSSSLRVVITSLHMRTTSMEGEADPWETTGQANSNRHRSNDTSRTIYSRRLHLPA